MGPLHTCFIICVDSADEYPYSGEVRIGIFFIHEKVWKCDFDRGKEPIQSHLYWKIGPLHTSCFIICVDSADEYPYSGEVRRKSKVGIFFIHEKFWKCDFDRGNEPIQSHLSFKIVPLHIIFIILINPADKYPYTEEGGKKFKVGIFFY